MDRDLATMTAVEMSAAFAAGTVSPVEVHDAVQTVIESRDRTLNAFWRRDPEQSRAAARDSEARWAAGAPLGPIDGAPVTLKENIPRAGVPMPAGCAGVAATLPQTDAPITARVLESGGVVLGSTVMPDWGMLSSGVSSLHGVTRSPWNHAWTTGGSSSGAGAAAAAGYGPLHVGTDIGGSLRLPGAWLGLVTLKPSFGRVPLHEPYLGRCAGPLTRTVDDTALLMSVLSQPDPRDWTSLPPADLDWSARDLDVRGLRIALHLDAGCGAEADPEIIRAVSTAAAGFESAGAHVEVLEPFLSQDLLDGLDLFWRVRSHNDYAALSPRQQEQVHPHLVQWCMAAADTSGARVLECYHQINRIRASTVAATSGFDVVVSPVTPSLPFAAEQPMPYRDDGKGMKHIGFTAPYNMSGQPAASINCGFSEDGHPIGMQVAGRRFDDVGVVRAIRWYERTRPAEASPRWPDITPPAPRQSGVDIPHHTSITDRES